MLLVYGLPLEERGVEGTHSELIPKTRGNLEMTVVSISLLFLFLPSTCILPLIEPCNGLTEPAEPPLQGCSLSPNTLPLDFPFHSHQHLLASSFLYYTSAQDFWILQGATLMLSSVLGPRG